MEQLKQQTEKAGKGKNPIIAVCVIIVVFVIGVYSFNHFQLQSKMDEVISFNHFQLQSKMDEVIKQDHRNSGIEVSVHFGNYLNSSVFVYDLKSVSGTNSMGDVFRVLLQFAEKMQSRDFDTVELSFRGKTKFKISGEYFQTLGKEYSWQNPVYTMRTFPEHLMNPDGSSAYPEWTGGWLGVTKEQMEDFNDFHHKWWLDDISSSLQDGTS